MRHLRYAQGAIGNLDVLDDRMFFFYILCQLVVDLLNNRFIKTSWASQYLRIFFYCST